MTHAALDDLAQHEAPKTGGNPTRLKSAIVRQLILEERERTRKP
jgi:hypothetical protein